MKCIVINRQDAVNLILSFFQTDTEVFWTLCLHFFLSTFLFPSVITIGIGETNIPTDDTLVLVRLGNAQGGATISSRSNVSIVIMAHDFVAGLLSLNQTSYFVHEGTCCSFDCDLFFPYLSHEVHVQTVILYLATSLNLACEV